MQSLPLGKLLGHSLCFAPERSDQCCLSCSEPTSEYNLNLLNLDIYIYIYFFFFKCTYYKYIQKQLIWPSLTLRCVFLICWCFVAVFQVATILPSWPASEVPPNLLLAVRLFWLPKMLERTVELQQLLRYGEWHGGHYVVKAEEWSSGANLHLGRDAWGSFYIEWIRSILFLSLSPSCFSAFSLQNVDYSTVYYSLYMR